MLQQKARELSRSQYISQLNLVFLLFRGMINAGSLLGFNCVLLLLFFHFINTSRAISLTALI